MPTKTTAAKSATQEAREQAQLVPDALLRELLSVAARAADDGDEWDIDEIPAASLELASMCSPTTVTRIVAELLEQRVRELRTGQGETLEPSLVDRLPKTVSTEMADLAHAEIERRRTALALEGVDEASPLSGLMATAQAYERIALLELESTGRWEAIAVKYAAQRDVFLANLPSDHRLVREVARRWPELGEEL